MDAAVPVPAMVLLEDVHDVGLEFLLWVRGLKARLVIEKRPFAFRHGSFV
jgi:hypothetical protein